MLHFHIDNTKDALRRCLEIEEQFFKILLKDYQPVT